jgi:amino acid transporter
VSDTDFTLRGIDYSMMLSALAYASAALMPWASAQVPQGNTGFPNVHIGGGSWSVALAFLGALLVIAILIATVTGRAMDYYSAAILSISALIVAICVSAARTDLANQLINGVTSRYGLSGSPSASPGAGAVVSIATGLLLSVLACSGMFLKRRTQQDLVEFQAHFGSW